MDEITEYDGSGPPGNQPSVIYVFFMLHYISVQPSVVTMIVQYSTPYNKYIGT